MLDKTGTPKELQNKTNLIVLTSIKKQKDSYTKKAEDANYGMLTLVFGQTF